MAMKTTNRMVAMFTAIMLAVSVTACADAGNDDGAAVAAAEQTETGSSYTQGMKYLKAMQYKEAADSFEEETKDAWGRKLEAAYRGLGIAYMGMGDYDNAVNAFENALKEAGVIPTGEEYDINYYLGSCYYKQGNYDDAMKVYDAIVTLKPKDPDAYLLRGTVSIAEGDLDGMISDFEKAISLDDANYDRIVMIYNTLVKNGCEDKATQIIQDILSSNGSSMDNYNLGRLNYYIGNYDEAKAAFEMVENPDFNVSILLGMTYEALGDYNYASSVYKTYLSKDQSHPEVYNQLGLCSIRMGEYQNALSAFQSGENVSDNSIIQSIQFNEIIAYEYLGDFRKAQVLMKDYLNNYPGDTKAQREYIFLKTR